MPPKLELGIQPTPEGVDLVVVREEDSFVVPMQVERAVQVFFAWWQALGHHYPKAHTQAGATGHPHMLATGDFSIAVDPMSSGLAQLWLRPTGCAGISFEMTPAQARDLAGSLVEAANLIEAFRKPH